MSSKRKQQSESWIDYISHELLFMRHFHIQTSLSPADCAHYLLEMSTLKRGWFLPAEIYQIQINGDVRGYHFDIRSRDGNRNHYTVAHAYGEITSIENGSIIEGQLRFGKVYFVLLLFSVVWIFFLSQLFGSFSPLILVLFLFSPLYAFWQMYRMRNNLLDDIQSALRPREGIVQGQYESTFSRLTRDEPENFYFDDEAESRANNYGR